MKNVRNHSLFPPSHGRDAEGRRHSSQRHTTLVASSRILGYHVFANVLSPGIVQISVSVAFVLLAETSLSFLSVGIRPPAPSWGADVGRGYRFMVLAPWLIFMPGTAILVTTLAFNFPG